MGRFSARRFLHPMSKACARQVFAVLPHRREFGNELAASWHVVIELSCIFFCGGAVMMRLRDANPATEARAGAQKKGTRSRADRPSVRVLLVVAVNDRRFLSPADCPVVKWGTEF